MLKLLNNPLASCSFINLDVLPPHTEHFDDRIVLPFLAFNSFGSTFSVLFLHSNNTTVLFCDDLIIYYALKNNDLGMVLAPIL